MCVQDNSFLCLLWAAGVCVCLRVHSVDGFRCCEAEKGLFLSWKKIKVGLCGFSECLSVLCDSPFPLRQRGDSTLKPLTWLCPATYAPLLISPLLSPWVRAWLAGRLSRVLFIWNEKLMVTSGCDDKALVWRGLGRMQMSVFLYKWSFPSPQSPPRLTTPVWF